MNAVKTSDRFKRHATRAILSIFFFIFVYFLLLVFAISVFAGCCIAAYYVIAIRPSIITFGLAIGILAVGFFILYFLIKFLFARSSSDQSHLTEIDEFQEPELFKVIEGLVKCKIEKARRLTGFFYAYIFFRIS